ncbi:MAG: AsmA family protein [Hyphomicrobiaceae bacterium]|nr:AsmA family protein [Hyphomicrobiaceae bacterium]
MPISRRIKRGLLVAAAVLGVLAMLVAAVPFVLSTDVVKRRVGEQISAWTGRPVILRGEPVITVFPHLTVKLKDVAVEGAIPGGTPIIVSESVKASLRLLPLIVGRIEIAEITMLRPQVTFYRDGEGVANWAFDAGRFGALVSPQEVMETGALSRLTITDASIRYIDDMSGERETLSGADFAISWPSASRPFSATGAFVWRGEQVEGLLSIGDLPALWRTGDTPARLTLAAPRLSLQFDGRASLVNGPQANGQITLSTPSLRRALSWMGVDLTAGSTLGPARISGALRLVGPLIEISEATGDLDGNSAEGAVAVSLAGERPAIQGTLDLARLDISPYMEGLRATTTASAPNDWRFRALEAPVFGLMDLDLRIAARRVILSSIVIDDYAGSVSLRDGTASLTIGTATLFGGALSGTLGAANLTNAPVRLEAGLSARDFQMRDALSGLLGIAPVDGTGNLDLRIAGTGDTFADVLRSSNGEASLSIEDGGINGIDIVGLAGLLARGTEEIDIATVLRGRTPVARMASRFVVTNGAAETRDTLIDGGPVQTRLTGVTDLFARTLDFTGLITVEQSGRDRLDVPFEIRGSWTSPLVLPDLSGLERRPGE